MSVYSTVFNKAVIYETLFFNIKSILIYPTINDLERESKSLYNHFINIYNNKYLYENSIEDAYVKYAPNHVEFNKIVAITYASVYHEQGELKRIFKKIVSTNEVNVIQQFLDVLQQLSKDGNLSEPKYYPMLCGYDIINFDIPLLIKRILVHRKEINNSIPLMLKNLLDSKPWDSNYVLDVNNVFKFNGFDNVGIDVISDMLNLKKGGQIISKSELSKYYWDNIDADSDKVLNDVVLQSAIITNIVIQFINEIRQL